MKNLSGLIVIGFFLTLLWFALRNIIPAAEPETPQRWTYTVHTLRGETVTGETWLPAETHQLEVYAIKGEFCLVGVMGKGYDVVLCGVDSIVHYRRHRAYMPTLNAGDIIGE
jgi:hypothetical protein